MKELVIIGAGGFGRTVYWQCDADYGNHREWTIKGFLDDRPDLGLRDEGPLDPHRLAGAHRQEQPVAHADQFLHQKLDRRVRVFGGLRRRLGIGEILDAGQHDVRQSRKLVNGIIQTDAYAGTERVCDQRVVVLCDI